MAIDKKRTEQMRKNLDEAFSRYYNSPLNQLLRERDRGIHPTSHDKEYKTMNKHNNY